MNTDALGLPELTERQERILALIVREYINKPDPVGSKLLAERYLPSVSSATIRNDMAALEDMGMITAPHHSAGRVPTETGYRYFVKRLLDAEELSVTEQQGVVEDFQDAPNEMESWLKSAVSTLARTSQSAAIVTAPRAVISTYKHMALVAVQGRMVMMVLVLHGGYVRQQMLTLSEPISQENLTTAAATFNALCEGKDADEIRSQMTTMDSPLNHEILDLVIRTLDERDHTFVPNIYSDGLSELLPELKESEATRQALRIMEQHTLLTAIMSEYEDQQIGDVQVVIAGNGRWSEVRHLSLVLSRYGVDGSSVGALGVFGPTRMRYGRAISAVRYVANMMSNLLGEVYGQPKRPDELLPPSKE
jgi:heat-inducible transcriptional repressor